VKWIVAFRARHGKHWKTKTREIAEKLHLSVKTVEAHRANIKAKLKLKSASELIHFAVRWSESQGTGT
jgi:FixJ family two-component response regulator